MNINDDLMPEDEEEEYGPLARLIELGRQKSFVTIEDILLFFPDAEQDVDQLEEVFTALLGAGVPYLEDASNVEPNEEDLAREDEEDDVRRTISSESTR